MLLKPPSPLQIARQCLGIANLLLLARVIAFLCRMCAFFPLFLLLLSSQEENVIISLLEGNTCMQVAAACKECQ